MGTVGAIMSRGFIVKQKHNRLIFISISGSDNECFKGKIEVEHFANTFFAVQIGGGCKPDK